MSSSTNNTTNGSSSSSSSLDHLPPSLSSSEQLCYVHCNLCDTVLAVSVPCSSLFKTVTVRCGHCTNLLPVNMRALLLQPPANQFHLPHNLFSPTTTNLRGEMPNPAPNHSITQLPSGAGNYMTPTSNRGSTTELPKPPTSNKPPEKRQRVPSAYNRFIKDEIQRIKAGNPDISHREAFSAAAKNWAHFPHIHFGLMSDQTVKRTNNIRPHHPQEAGDARMKDGFFAASANVGVSPY